MGVSTPKVVNWVGGLDKSVSVSTSQGHAIFAHIAYCYGKNHCKELAIASVAAVQPLQCAIGKT